MDTIFCHIQDIIRDCECNFTYYSSILFLKQKMKNGHIELISIQNTGNGKRSLREYKINDRHYIVYSLDLTFCLYLLLKKDAIYAAIFTKTICIVDKLGMARELLLGVEVMDKPIYGLENNLSLNQIEKAMSSIFQKERENEFCVRFCNVSDTKSFYSNIFYPLANEIKDTLSNCNLLFQYDTDGRQKNINVSFFFIKEQNIGKLVEKLQMFLYNHSPEYQLQSIHIPYVREHNSIEHFGKEIWEITTSALSTIQYPAISETNIEKDEIESLITHLIVIYILTAKFFYQDIDAFYKVNNQLYEHLLHEHASDVCSYALNVLQWHAIIGKIEREHNNLSKQNMKSLYSNYTEMLKAWDMKEQIGFDLYQEKLFLLCKKIKEQGIGIKNKDSIFISYTELLLNSYDIPAYYKAYIIYTIKFMIDEF